MSLIIGTNLSDRVYLTADTRLTFKNEGKENYYDYVLKIQPLSNEIAVAVAGDIEMAAFIVKELILSKVKKDNINIFRSESETLIKKIADDFFRRGNGSKSACFIFAGIDKTKKKIINFKKYFDILKNFQKETSSPMGMKDIIVRGMKSGKNISDIEIPIADSKVFCYQISPNNFIVEDVEWGDFIAYGGGLNKKHLPDRIIGQLEIAAKAPEKDFQHDRGWLDIFAKTTAEENGVRTIGGCITTLALSENFSGMLLGGTKRMRTNIIAPVEIMSEISIIGKKLYCLCDNKKQKLIPFTIYPDLLLKDNPRAERLTL
jgi:hypothetical protein